MKGLLFLFLLQETYVVDICKNPLGEAILTIIRMYVFWSIKYHNFEYL